MGPGDSKDQASGLEGHGSGLSRRLCPPSRGPGRTRSPPPVEAAVGHTVRIPLSSSHRGRARVTCVAVRVREGGSVSGLPAVCLRPHRAPQTPPVCREKHGGQCQPAERGGRPAPECSPPSYGDHVNEDWATSAGSRGLSTPREAWGIRTAPAVRGRQAPTLTPDPKAVYTKAEAQEERRQWQLLGTVPTAAAARHKQPLVGPRSENCTRTARVS